MKYFFSTIKAHKVLTVITFMITAVQSALWVGVGLFISYITDQVIAGTASIPMIALSAVVLCTLLPFMDYLLLQTVDRWKIKLRGSMEYVLAGYASHACDSPAEVQNSLGQEADALIASYFDQIRVFFSLIVRFVVAVIAGFLNSWMITVAVLVLVLFSMWISSLPAKRLSRNFQAVQKENQNVLAVNGAVVGAAFDLRIYGARDFAHALSYAAIKERLKALRTDGRFKGNVGMLNTLLSTITEFGAIIAALALVALGWITFGNMMAIFLILQYIIGPLKYFMQIKNNIDTTIQLREKFTGYEHRYIAARDSRKQEHRDLSSIDSIEADDISFSYNGEDTVLQSISAMIAKGERVLILGKSGCGKSTLIKLLLRDISPTQGRLLLNGENIENFDPHTMYRHVGYIGQRSRLLPIRLGQNLALADDYEEGRARDCLAAVNLPQFQPDYLIDESFGNLSGGELQRVLLARLLYHDRDFLVFDEFTSSLDPKNAYELEKLVLNLEGKTVLHVTHKISAELLKKYDTLMILRDGELAYCGAPLEMEEIQPYYA